MNPYPGLTLESSEGELVNVHFVRDGTVGWGRYRSHDDDDPELLKTSLSRWHTLFDLALRDGAACCSLLVGDATFFGKVGVFDWKTSVQ